MGQLKFTAQYHLTATDKKAVRYMLDNSVTRAKTKQKQFSLEHIEGAVYRFGDKMNTEDHWHTQKITIDRR